MPGQGSVGNSPAGGLAAFASLVVPGLGQLLQGRLGMTISQFGLAVFLWFFLLSWIIHLWSRSFGTLPGSTRGDRREYS